MDIDFEQLFDDKILNRAYEYYMDGNVKDVIVTSDHIQASVYGSESYQVDITLENGVIQEMNCNCPYASNAHCKHEAAVLFEVTNNEYEVSAQLPCINKQDTEKEILATIPKEELILFLSTYITEDAPFRLNFHTYFSQYYTLSYHEFVNEWNTILYEQSDHTGFINYHQSTLFEIAVEKLNDKLQNASKNQPNVIFKVIATLYYELCDLPIDDSNGTTNTIAHSFQNTLIECLNSADETLKKEIQLWVLNAMDSVDLANYSLEEGLDEVYLKTLPVSEQIEYLQENARSSKDVKELLTLLQQNHTEEKNIKAIMEQLQSIHTARDWLIDYHLKHEEIDTVIGLLHAGIKTRKKESYTIQLLHVYKTHGYQKEYDSLMRASLSEPFACILDLYQEYKQAYSDQQWRELYPDLIQTMVYPKDRMKCYAIENRKDSLIYEIEQSNVSFSELLGFEKLLLPDYEHRLIQKYRAMAEKVYPYTGNENYNYIFMLIEHILKMPSGKLVAIEMVGDLKKEYRARRNLMKLLKTLPIFEFC